MNKTITILIDIALVVIFGTLIFLTITIIANNNKEKEEKTGRKKRDNKRTF